MKIINKGRGVHSREVAGIKKLQEELPGEWIAFTNLELALPHGGREIDVILVIEDRIIAVDIKDWRGKIESSGGAWSLNGQVRDGGSPVTKILNNARELWLLLEKYLRQPAYRVGGSSQFLRAPKVEGCVVLTGTNDRSGIAPTEVNKVFSIDQFIKMLKSSKQRIEELGGVAPEFYAPGITTPAWKEHWNRFFNVSTGAFRVSTRQYGSYRAESDTHLFQHSKKIFSEFGVVDLSAAGATGLLRRWDFTKADPRFQNEDARLEIAGRERKVIAWLNDRNPEFESAILQPKVDDPDKGVEYWEVFERRRRLQRLSDLSTEQIKALPRDVRIELLRQVVARIKVMHNIGASHLDLSPHSVWIESPSITRISHLMAASFPDVASLGSTRYQFLSSVKLPEDFFDTFSHNQRRDVYLLGCVAHMMFFGTLPQESVGGEPPEWNSQIDLKEEFTELHDWIACALDWTPENRFTDASAMLDALNIALDTKISTKSVLEGLERFRTISSQRKLFSEFPVVEDLRDDLRVGIWISEVQGRRLLVKLWKRESWGDQAKEAPRLLAFLEHAESLIRDHPPGCIAIERAIWTGDALVLVCEYLDAPSLAKFNIHSTTVWSDRIRTLTFLQALAQNIMALHARLVAHGDLKPDNILVEQMDGQPQPVLIDIIDFVPADDGERISTAYAQPSGGRFERDCFAVTKIVEEILELVDWTDLEDDSIHKAISQIRESQPENATLLPLIEAIDAVLKPTPAIKIHQLNLVIPGEEEFEFLSDEGKISLRLLGYGSKLCLCGATEQIVVNLDANGDLVRAGRQLIDQKQLSRESKFEFATLTAKVSIENGVFYDLSAISELLVQPEIAQRWAKARDETPKIEIQDGDKEQQLEGDEAEDVEIAPEVAEDQLSEVAARQEVNICDINIPQLWGRLLELEADLTIEGSAIGDSKYRTNVQRFIVPFELEKGSFDFARDDTVTVARLERGGRWMLIGYLDLSSSSSFHLEIFPRKWVKASAALVVDGQRLRFESHFEVTSRSRRMAATQRLLSRESRVAELIDVFHPSTALLPTVQNISLDREALINRYGLNPVQADAFGRLVNLRPVGLLQGPPGTGKTRFIAALVHYALTHGLARNVLLSSQSHEAVNGATEEVIKLFREDKVMPSVLRVGHEGNVSEQLLPYHVAQVERLIKDRFRAEQRSRLHVVGRALAIPSTLVDRLITIETVVRPIAEKILQLRQDDSSETLAWRIAALQKTLEDVAQEKLNLLDGYQHVVDELYLDGLAAEVASAERFTNVAKVDHFRNVTELARDFMGNVSSRERTLETFLAGTRSIVAGTCVGLGRSSLGLTSTPFDLVIVDEAARCTAGELAVPLQSGRWIVMVGDQRQLEPQHRSEIVRQVAKDLQIMEREILRSDFERVFESEYGRGAGFSLTEQYRMLPCIGSIVSSAFYENKLTHGRHQPIIGDLNLPHPLEKSLTWLMTDGFGEAAYQNENKHRKGALSNAIEADLIVGMIVRWDADNDFREWIEKHNKSFQSIGIICTYRAQSQLIKDKLKKISLSEVMRATVKVDTVDSYQGKQNPIVILSLVRNNADGCIEDAVATIRDGFMAQPNRLNVAISRAMDRLLLVGATARWRKDSPMAKIAHEFRLQESAGHAIFVDGVVLKEQVEAHLNSGKKSKTGVLTLEEEYK